VGFEAAAKLFSAADRVREAILDDLYAIPPVLGSKASADTLRALAGTPPKRSLLLRCGEVAVFDLGAVER